MEVCLRAAAQQCGYELTMRNERWLADGDENADGTTANRELCHRIGRLIGRQAAKSRQQVIIIEHPPSSSTGRRGWDAFRADEKAYWALLAAYLHTLTTSSRHLLGPAER